jgi:hypothetical protein
LRGEAQVGAGQSVDARLCTLILIYDAISDKPIVSLGMVNWVPSALRLGYAGGSPEVVPHLTWPIAKTLAVAILINSIEMPGRLAMQAAMSDLAAECGEPST